MKKHKSMRLDEIVIRQIDAIAGKEKRSFSNMVEVILSEYVEGEKMEQLGTLTANQGYK